jgi:hypothetical protein
VIFSGRCADGGSSFGSFLRAVAKKRMSNFKKRTKKRRDLKSHAFLKKYL